MTQEQIIAIATQAAIAAVQATMGATAPVSNPTQAQGARSKGQDKPKALPDATASAIGDIVAGATKEGVENGKKLEEPKGKAYLFEYSEKMLAIWGDTKANRETIKKYGGKKFGIIWGYQPEGASEPNLAEGWYIYKSKLEKAGGQKAFVAELKKAGLKVTIGESIRAITEAYRAEHPREEQPKKETTTATTATTTEKPKRERKPKGESAPKIVPITTPSYEGVGFKPSGKFEGSFTQYAKNHDIYLHEGGAYICIGAVGEATAFLFVGKVADNGDIAHYDLISHIAEYGFPYSVSDGTIKKVGQWHFDAFKESDEEAYKWLVQNVKVAA